MNKYSVVYDVNFSDGFYDQIEEEFNSYFEALELYQKLFKNPEIVHIHLILREDDKIIFIY